MHKTLHLLFILDIYRSSWTIKKGKHSLSLGKPSIALQIVFQHLKAICFNNDESIQSKLCSRKKTGIFGERKRERRKICANTAVCLLLVYAWKFWLWWSTFSSTDDKLTVTHVHHHLVFAIRTHRIVFLYTIKTKLAEEFLLLRFTTTALQLFFPLNFKPQNRPVSHILQEKKNLIRYTFKPS